jgi:hypothetical protein
MFPYASVTNKFEGQRAATTRDLATMLRAVWAGDQKRVRRELVDQITAQMGSEMVSVSHEVVHESFSLKYSKSSSSWTAYLFLYHRGTLNDPGATLAVESVWVRLRSVDIQRLTADPTINGRPVAGNVISILDSEFVKALG